MFFKAQIELVILGVVDKLLEAALQSKDLHFLVGSPHLCTRAIV